MQVAGDIVLLIVLYSVLAITGLVGNCWVLITVSRQLFPCNGMSKVKPTLHSSAYIYLILLSIVDLFSLVPVPVLVRNLLENQWTYGNFLCRLMYVCEGANKTLSPMVLTALSIDRYIAICRPKLVWMRQTPFALGVIASFLVASSIFIVPFAALSQVHYMRDDKGRCIEKCSMFSKPVIDLLHVVVCYFIPLLIIISVYLAILGKLFRHTRYSSVGRKTSISLSRVLKCSVMVVAFYFFCWTPYWCLRLQVVIDDFLPNSDNSTVNYDMPDQLNEDCLESSDIPSFDNTTVAPQPQEQFGIVFWMCLVHAFPYAQSAFNWLFYAFLNRNLRNSAARHSHVIRSAQVTSTVLENGNSASQTRSPLWKNIQHVGIQLKSAGIDTGHALLRLSPFRSRSAVQSRSSVCLDSTFSDRLLPPGAHMSNSMMEIQRKNSPFRSDFSEKTFSYSEIAHPVLEPEPSKVSESSSVEWL